MSDLLSGQRQEDEELQHSVPKGSEWATTDPRRPQPRRPFSPRKPIGRASSQKQEKDIKRRLELGPLQFVKSDPHFKVLPYLQRFLLHSKFHSGAPFCSMVFGGGSSSAEPRNKPPVYTPRPTYTVPSVGNVQRELSSRQKMLVKARSATVLPVVSLSRNGEWVPQAFGRKEYARITARCTGGWSRGSIPFLRGDQATHKGRYCLHRKREEGEEAQRFHYDRPILNSTAFLLQKLRNAEKDLDDPNAWMQVASELLKGEDVKRHHRRQQSREAGLLSRAHDTTKIRHQRKDRFSVRSCCTIGSKKKSQ
ncbi:hypothetical protein KP509_29G086100 [Ceratopteris richardii]|uniref:Uncharacterized protein n=1 Tax=Ceratopteris richardii TaxID=49495 RepID=A0A8T2RB79_CERRI|nr:hypothetical protein KP509_29G086100 [Ceratopteris richardii]